LSLLGPGPPLLRSLTRLTPLLQRPATNPSRSNGCRRNLAIMKRISCGKTAQFAVTLLLGITAAWAVSQSLPASQNDASASGERLFSQSCASCHNAHSAKVLVGPGMKGYYTTHRPRPSGSALRTIISKGKGTMPGFSGLRNAQIDDLIAYLKTL
jgi:mono/diheme cytochrome c family protein